MVGSTYAGGLLQEIDIVNKTRAAASAIVGLALTAGGVLAAAPQAQAPANTSAVTTLAQDSTAVGGTNDNHGGAVSTLAKTLEIETPATDTPDTSTDGAQGAHGAAVRAVAQDDTLVGGTNDNHGGAVSTVARGTHGATAVHGNSAGNSQSGVHPVAH